MLHFNPTTGVLSDERLGLNFADRPLGLGLSGFLTGGRAFAEAAPTESRCAVDGRRVRIDAAYRDSGLRLTYTLEPQGDDLVESVIIDNPTSALIQLNHMEIGLVADLASRADWRLIAIPFRKQLDGSLHDFTGAALARADFRNTVYRDASRPEPGLMEDRRVRSEAWAWGTGERGLVVMKYNNEAIELSVAALEERPEGAALRFGGAGFCLYGEPSAARRLEPGHRLALGRTVYSVYEGGLEQAFYRYRRLLDERGHGFPADYDPPVNWNELYDVGWFHSDAAKLAECYTRAALLKEAEKARQVGCDLLYLDPGWGVCEGSTRWDDARLGTTTSLAQSLRQDYGLGLGFRAILRDYREPAQDGWPADALVQRRGVPRGQIAVWGQQRMWELCLCHRPLWEEKVRRIVEIARQGVSFIMIDEFDWRGPCEADDHTHPRPTTAHDHARAVFDLCREVRRRCPGVVIECHDPIWPWFAARYLPTYFRQGFGEAGDFEENWGFEYMWDCLSDLRSGKALALYYYNLACSIPLYLHITMAADNDACVFFWWAASTVRHLGIGGRDGHPSVTPSHLGTWDKARRFDAYRAAMSLYRRLKPWFVRGEFHGLREDAHLHTLPGQPGGVLMLFNLTDKEAACSAEAPASLLGGHGLDATGAECAWSATGLTAKATLAPMSACVIGIGAAASRVRS